MIRRHTLRAAEMATGRLLVAAVLCVSVIFLASHAFAAAFVAQAVKTRGDIRITRDGGDMPCGQGTARLRLRFVDGSILTLGENTKLSVDLFAVDAANKSRTVVMTVLEGIVNAAAAKSGENKFDYQIKTDIGYSAVRGTRWIVGFQQALMTVYVLNGTVEMGVEGGKPPVLINTGQWGSIDAAGALSPAQPTTPEMLKPVLDATDDTAMNNSVPPSTTTPGQPLIPLPQITPVPTRPTTPTHQNNPNTRNQGGGKGTGGGGYGGGMTGN
jgi:hypothetical protein